MTVLVPYIYKIEEKEEQEERMPSQNVLLHLEGFVVLK